MRIRRAVAAVAVFAVVGMSACASPLVGRLAPGGSGGGSTDGSPGGSPGGRDEPPALVPVRPTVDRCDQPGGTAEFERAEPAEVALDHDAVVDAVTYATARGAQSVRVYRGDCLVATSANDPETEWVPLPSWSMSKGMVSLVVGRAVTLGLLEVDDPIGAHLSGLSERHGAITVRQLLTQTSGLRFAWANDLNDAGQMDSVARVLARPFESEPGTTYVYAQTAVTVLVAVLEAAAGEDFQEFAARELFEPIGIRGTEWTWARDVAGHTQGFAFLDMTPRAYGRIGSLLLNEGRWNGEELVSASYVRQARTGTEANPAYGFLWWTNDSDRIITAGFPIQQHLDHSWVPAAPRDAFGMTGMFDQHLIVIPSLDMVVVRMGLPHDLFGDPLGEVQMKRPRWEHRFFRQLLAGVRDVDVPDPGDWVPDPEIKEADWFHLIGIGF